MKSLSTSKTYRKNVKKDNGPANLFSKAWQWYQDRAGHTSGKYNTYSSHIPENRDKNANQILKSFGITDKASFNKWIIANHPDKNPAPGQTEKFQTVFKLWKQVNGLTY